MLAICQACFATAQNCSVIYVDIAATGAGDGTSWQDAFTNLQDAITESANCLDVGVSIWVAQGIYLPDVGETQFPGNRYETFYLLDNLIILGGFNGTETEESQRDWLVNETILSGDVGISGDESDNIYTIITAFGNDATAILDGFTIRDANAGIQGIPFEDPTRSGGGLFNILGSPTIRNCKFENNEARNYGGGVYTEEGNPLFDNCTFLQNKASSGAGFYNKNGSPVLSGCTFHLNDGSFGGGVYLSGGDPVLENCIIQGNTASFGGGMATASNANVHSTNCLISGNRAGFGGGVNNGAEMSFYNCTIAGNHADSRGGGIQSTTGNLLLENCILWDNTANTEGNQLWNGNPSSAIVNHTCYTNGSNDISPGGNFMPDAGCITVNPLFVAPSPIATAPNTGGDYHLRAISAAVDAGDNLAISGVVSDLDNNPRIANALVDMGAFEWQQIPASCPGTNRLYVNSAATAGGNGTSWTTAFKYLQDALIMGAGCSNITEIWVARGTYRPDRGEGFVAGNRDAAFQMSNNLAIYGGFSGSETTLEQRNWTTFVSTLSGDIGVTDAPDDNSYTVVSSSATNNSAVIDGFTIQDGQATNTASITYSSPRSCGGGIFNEGGSPIIRNCTFKNNQADDSGGAIYNWRNSTPLIDNCTFMGNFSGKGSSIHNERASNAAIHNCFFSNNSGSAIYNAESSATISQCNFVENDATFGGGVFNLSDSMLVLTNCVFAGNTASFGGALFNQSGSFSCTNCLFTGNEAPFGGAIHNLGETNQIFTNCTFSGNRASSRGGAIRNQGLGDGSTILNNCILWGNLGGGIGNQIQSEGNIIVTLHASCYANAANDIDVNGILVVDADCTTENPLFINPVLPNVAPTTAGNYRLSPCSPVINEGLNELIPPGTTDDLDNEVRIVSGLVDMGAYEFRDTGNLQLPQISLDVANPACSNIPTGSATASVTGGAMPYAYLWSGGQITPDLSDLPPGDYALTVTDNSGCRASVGFSIMAPAPIETLTENLQDALCGAQNGRALVTVSGGIPPYDYFWSTGQTTAAVDNLPGGIHVVSITDANGCLQTDTVSIAQSDAVTADFSEALLVSCLGNDGQLSVQASGGSGLLSYLWSNDATTATINGLSAGDYSLTVSDELGCTAILTTNLGSLPAFGSELAEIENISCNGLTDGSATVLPVNGIAPFTYLWEDGQTTATAENLAPGDHSVMLTDGNGCTTTQIVTVIEPALLEVTIPVVMAVTCLNANSGQATALAIGGTGPYDYLWSNGQDLAAATGLEAGNYTVQVTDANGCVASNAVSILPPAQPQASISGFQNPSACAGDDGEATVAVTGGTAPYNYLWSNGQMSATTTGLTAGDYSVVATDAAGCTAMASVSITSPPMFESEITNIQNAICNGINDGAATVSASGGTPPYSYMWDTGETTPTASGLNPGQHHVVVMDARGCVAESDLEITAAVMITTTVTLESSNSCFGDEDGAVLVTPANGMAPYVYLWSNGADTPEVTNLAAGSYFVSITDANGCMAEAGAIITQPPLLLLSVNGANALCGNSTGSATAEVSGGTPPYSYLWSNGQTTATAQNLTPGIHSVTVQDAKHCTSAGSINITAPEPLEGSIADLQAASCVDVANGSATVLATGGTAPYNYLWSDGQDSATAVGLFPGNYSVLIRDANNCTVGVQITIASENPALDATIMLDGTTFFALQGNAQYQWIDCSNNLPVAGATSQSFIPEISGSYAVIIRVDDCSVQSVCTNVTITALEGDLSAEFQPIQVFPNPNHGVFSMILPEQAQILFYNASGEQLWRQELPPGRHEIHQKSLPAGVYWLHAVRKNRVETLKVVVE